MRIDINYKLENMWKASVVTYLEILPPKLTPETEEIHNTP
jgi:hypothetical protein